MRLLVQWNLAAKTRPATPTNPFDPAYVFDDVDEAVRAAQDNDQEVILTISGTPRWANGGKNPNVMPNKRRRLHELLAGDRIPVLRTIRRVPVRPVLVDLERAEPPAVPEPRSSTRAAARLRRRTTRSSPRPPTRASRRETRRHRSRIGETSARGSDKPNGLRPTHSPGKFAELVAKANPRLKFDAWSHHPYPSNPNSPPTQIVKWPNVSLASLPRFDESLKKWFKRKSVPIWITEYGHQTQPEDSLGVLVRDAGRVHPAVDLDGGELSRSSNMFIWFVYQDDQGQPWESGDLHAQRRAEGNLPCEIRGQCAAARRAERRRDRPRGTLDATAVRPTHAATARTTATGPRSA